MLLHGNGGCALDWVHYADNFQAIEPMDFYILEYPGYGGRAGSPTQTNIIRAAEEAFKAMPEKCLLYVVGESLGTGVATWLAGKHDQNMRGVFLVAPYNNLSAVAQSHLPLFPVKLMLKDKYPSDEWIENYHGPLAIVLAEKDEVVPMRFGRELYEEYRGPKKLWIEAGATHDDVHSPRTELCKEVVEFWNENTR